MVQRKHAILLIVEAYNDNGTIFTKSLRHTWQSLDEAQANAGAAGLANFAITDVGLPNDTYRCIS